MVEPTSLEHLQADVIEMMPTTWTTISMSLSDDASHLYITRYETAHSPSLFRLPLKRSTAHDNEEDEAFSFQDAKAELLDIIQCSNATAHMARSNPEAVRSQAAKTRWWSEREALDGRLRDLLLNMENLWIGGFKGLFSTHEHRDELSARFGEAFEKVLDEHLPSRRRTGRRRGDKIVKLHSRVFDLFTGLDTTRDGDDLGEALGDLLYFVVDVLQLNGEANAYDEIDFDSVSTLYIMIQHDG